MAFLDDFTVDLDAGDIRHASGNTVYSVLDAHVALQDRADDADGIDNDNPSSLAGTRNATIPSILTLLNDGPEGTAYNIDDAAAQFISFGSIEQDGGQTLYSGLKTIGSIVAGSPMYVVQNGVKLNTFWPDGHIQIMVKVRATGDLIDNGDVTVFSRKYGQTYNAFDLNLAAGSESSAAITTALDASITLSEVEAAAVLDDLTIVVGDVSRDLNNGNGSRTYGGVIDCGGRRLSEVYQALQYLTRQGSVDQIDGVAGEIYRKLKPAYAAVSAAPFGTFAGGTFFAAQGWFLENVPAADATAYQLIDDTGDAQSPPITAVISVGNLIAGDRVIVTRQSGGSDLKQEYTAAAGNDAGGGVFVINEPIKVDTPAAGQIRISDGQNLEYSGYAGSAFTLVGAIGADVADGASLYVPFISRVATGIEETASYLDNGGNLFSVDVRNSAVQMQPFRGTFSAGPTGGSINAQRNSDA
ncbi:MAG: hypothetical protein AAF415_02240 [Pseudomonadota bacterium]